MQSRTKGLFVLLSILMVFGAWYFGDESMAEENNGSITGLQKDTIYVWYTDEALSGYMNSVALDFYEETDIRVVPVLKTGSEYIEEIYSASISGNEIPDVYVVGSDSIEKAAMLGVACPVNNEREILSTAYFPKVALDAATYHEEYFGYPMYFETSFLLYNRTHLEQLAEAALYRSLYGEELEEIPYGTIPEEYRAEEWHMMLEQKMQEIMPHSIEAILTLAENYDAPEGVENYFLWDVSDILYNYFFAGAYMNVGGVCGDDASIIEICNQETIACMQVYQELHQFFSIDSKESSYVNVLQNFAEGKTIFTIATIDAISMLEMLQDEGEFEYEFGVAPLPGIDEMHEARGLSVTNVAVINGYSNQKEAANAFAAYLTFDSVNSLYDRAQKMQAAYPIEDFMTDIYDQVREIYLSSTSLPKILEISNFWIQLELAYVQIWDGANVEETLQQLSDKMNSQINGITSE